MHDVEVSMARAALRIGALLLPLSLVLGYVMRGTNGALTAAGGVTLVVGVFWITGRSLGWAGRVSPIALQAVALGGFFIRLVLYAVLIVLLGPVEAIDGPALAISVMAATVIVLTYEVRFVMATPTFWWVDASAGKEPA